MARYRNDGSMPLKYGSDGPEVRPGETFDGDQVPIAQLESHLRSGFVSRVPDDTAPPTDEE